VPRIFNGGGIGVIKAGVKKSASAHHRSGASWQSEHIASSASTSNGVSNNIGIGAAARTRVININLCAAAPHQNGATSASTRRRAPRIINQR